MKDKVMAVILSGGSGTRLGSEIPKQYIEVFGKPIISYSLEIINKSKSIDGIWIVAEPKWQEKINVDGIKKFEGFSMPGENRQLSILNALRDINNQRDDVGYVFIHDAARPMITVENVDEYIAAANGHDGVLPVLPMKDTVYQSIDGNSVSALLDRKQIFAGQAPEVFAFDKYLAANEKLVPDKILRINGSTEPAILAKMDIVMVPGNEDNFKITTKSDMDRFIEIIRGNIL